jgi:hypothetical protein
MSKFIEWLFPRHPYNGRDGWGYQPISVGGKCGAPPRKP